MCAQHYRRISHICSFSGIVHSLLSPVATIDQPRAMQVRGRTARLMGVNLGHRAIGSNAWQFMQRMGVNAARLFLYTTIPCVRPSPDACCPVKAMRQLKIVTG